jgi:hypothetical protein
MAGQRERKRNMEGDNEELRREASRARAAGKLPSEVGATRGASKQRKEVRANASHQERIETHREGKRGAGTSGKPKPGSRETDPKRTGRWG